MPDVALGILIVITFCGATMAVALRKVFHNLLGFGLSLIGLAGISLLLGSEFVALMQLLIFLGGIAVAMVFAVMMSTPREQAEEAREASRVLPALIVGLGFPAVVAALLLGGSFPVAPVTTELFGVHDIGMALLTRFELPFEAVSLLLLGSIIGAVAVARRTREESSDG
jgi:NADH-quinone oxidoreductase subunit J